MKHNQNGFGIVAIFAALLVIIVVGVIGVIVYRHPATNPHRTDTEVAYNTRAILTVTTRGGLCSYGGCAHPAHNLYDNGDFDDSKKLNKYEVADLKKIIQDTDFTKYGPNPAPACQSFVDGTDRVLLFPQKYGDKTFTPCMLNIPKDDKTFLFINQLLASHYKQ